MSANNVNCASLGLPAGSFPCDAKPIEALSMGMAAGGVALLFSVLLVLNVSIMVDFQEILSALSGIVLYDRNNDEKIHCHRRNRTTSEDCTWFHWLSIPIVSSQTYQQIF